MTHVIYMGFRTIRDAQGRYPSMPFARCTCGWAGPGRLNRAEADKDGRSHEDATEARP